MKSKNPTKWDVRFIDMVRLVASWSSDESTKCGCVIVSPDNTILTTGYNGLPRRAEYTPERTARPMKYMWFEHSERNAIYNAARHGVALHGCKAYVTGPPCVDCARALVQAGIKEVAIPSAHNFTDRTDDKWTESCRVAEIVMAEGCIDYYKLQGL